MSQHQEQPLKTVRDQSGCRDKIMMSRHHNRATETYKDMDDVVTRDLRSRLEQ